MSIGLDHLPVDDTLDFTRFRERQVRDWEVRAERLTGAVADELVTLGGPLAAVASVLNAVASPEHGACDLDVLPTLMPPDPIIYRAVIEKLSAMDGDADVVGLIHHFHHRLGLVSRATRPALFRGAPELGGTIDVTALADAWRDLCAAIIDIVGRVQDLGCLSPGSAARFERVLGPLLDASEGGSPCLQADGCVEVPGILERRKYERLDVFWMAWITENGAPVSAAVRDISQGGAGLDCEIALPIGTPVVLDVKDRQIPAMVAWTTVGRVGIEFERALSAHDPLMREARQASKRR